MVSFVFLFFGQDSPFINCKNLLYKDWLDYQTTDSVVSSDADLWGQLGNRINDDKLQEIMAHILQTADQAEKNVCCY